MKKKIFISYDFNDASYKGEVEQWLKEVGAEVFSKNRKDIDPQTDEQAARGIKEQIQQVELFVILVGNNTHNRPWVDYEVAVARAKQIPTYCIRLANRSGAGPEEIRGLVFIDFNETNLKNLVK